MPILLSGAVLFLIGAAGFAKAVVRSGLLPVGPARVVAVALVVMAVARLVPFSSVQFHVQGVAGLLALWPLSYLLWSEAYGPGPAAAGAHGERAAPGAPVSA